MEMNVTFPGGKKVEATLGAHGILTDQPREAGGDDAAPAPFELFLFSLGTCGGYYVLAFCQARKIPTENLKLTMSWERNPDTHLIGKILLDVHLPPDFPEKYRSAVVLAARTCAVAKHLENPPAIEVRAV